jgi:hypothetical protein
MPTTIPYTGDSKWVPIRNKIEDFLGIAKDVVLPIAAIAVAFFNLPVGVAAVLRWLPSLMAIVEEASPEAGTGPAKKAQVMKAAQDLMTFSGEQFTGGAAENFAKYAPLISATIDSTIGAINRIAPQIVANDPPGPPTEVPGN